MDNLVLAVDQAVLPLVQDRGPRGHAFEGLSRKGLADDGVNPFG